MRRVALPLLLLALSVLGSAPSRVCAEDATTAYDPVPEALLEVRGSEADEALATTALRDLEAALGASFETDRLLDARSLLVLLGDVGLKHAALRLATEPVPPQLLPHLLHVVQTASHPAADALLGVAATEARSSLRAMAADGLGKGRSEGAVKSLALLARDPVPAVRAAALRALFAIESEAAITARQSLPVDERPDLNERRLRWHRLRGHATDRLLPMALATWSKGRTPSERLQAMYLLTLPALQTPLAVLEAILAEVGTDPFGSTFTRLAHGTPRRGYEPRLERLVAVMAGWASLYRKEIGEEQRVELVDRLVGWLARPVRANPFDDRPSPGNVLRMVLPDLGALVLEPTVRRLETDGFRDPQDGVDLLLEALQEEQAAEVLAALVDPRRKAWLATSVRVAAAGGLRQLRRVLDEALARALVREGEEVVIQRDTVAALTGQSGAWVVPLLAELAASEDLTMSSDAIAALEARADEEAMGVLVEHLFQGARNPDARLDFLVARADDRAFEVLRRALDHPRHALRCGALRQMHLVPELKGTRARALLRAFSPRAASPVGLTHELQQIYYAWIALDPAAGLAWARENWPLFRSLDWESNAVKTLRNARGPDIDAAVIDLVFEKLAEAGDDTTPELLRVAATALEGRVGHRDDDLDTFWRQALSHEDESVVWSAIRSLEHPGRGDLTDLLLPMLEELDEPGADAVHRAHALLEVLEYQPAPRVEPALVKVLLDVRAEPALRRRAGVLLVDRCSAATRSTLLERLVSEAAGDDDPSVLRTLARVVGTGGGEAIAVRAHAALADRLSRAFETEESLDPDEESWHKQAAAISALTRAIAYTEYEPVILQLVDRVFDARFARFARRAVALQARRLGSTDVTASARVGPGMREVWHRKDGRYPPIPPEVSLLLQELKPVGDDILARAFENALAPRRTDGTLAAFPDLYLDRVIVPLCDLPTGDREQAAEVVARWVGPLEPIGGAADFDIANARAKRYARKGRYAEASREHARATAILARRAYDDEPQWNWRRARSAVDAWRGAALVAEGRTDEGERAFAKAYARNPYDTSILLTVARARALVRADLDRALALARRARILESRVLYEVSLDAADTLALVHLERGEPMEAADSIAPVLRRTQHDPWLGGRYHLRLAQALCVAGDVDGGARAALGALRREPTLAEEMRRDVRLAPLREEGRLDALVQEARDGELTQLDE